MQDIQNLMGKSNEPTNELEELNKANTAEEIPESEGDMDAEALIKMMMTGENTNGMFTPDAEEAVEDNDKDKIHKNTTETNDVKVGKTLETSKKYREAMMKDMTKNPEKFKIETPEGEMTIKEALEKGYNPVTKKFEGRPHKKNIEDAMARLNDKERAQLEQLTDPANVGLAPADAEAMGLPANSPMIAQQQAAQQAQAQQTAAPPMAQDPSQAQQPQQNPQEAMPDIAALLGGAGGNLGGM